MALKASQLKVGDTHVERVVENLSRTQIVHVLRASRATTIRCTPTRSTSRRRPAIPAVFAHGMLTMGLTGKMLTNYVGDGRLTKFGVRFTNQVWPGDDSGCQGDGRRDPRGGRAAFRRSDAVHHQPGRQGSRQRKRDRTDRSLNPMVAGHPRLSRDKSLQRNGTIDLTCGGTRSRSVVREVDRLDATLPRL